MHSIQWQIPAYLVTLAALLLVATGCEPEFEDDRCQFTSDCFPDETCVNGRCVISGMAGDAGPDADDEENECGGTETLDGAVGDPCGPCELDLLECAEDGEALVCDGDTACPELDIITIQPEDVTGQGATLRGSIQSFPVDAELSELGFCWAANGTVSIDESTCQSLDLLSLEDIPDAGGDFSLAVDGLRAGTAYSVAAYSVLDDDTEELANTVDFETDALAPANVSAEGDADVVTVTWDAVDGATHYEVFADGQPLGTTDDGDQTSFIDETAPAGGLTPPLAIDASDNRIDGVRLTWDESEPTDGEARDYSVIAYFDTDSTATSDSVEARRTGKIAASYELYIGDDTPAPDDWMDLGDTTIYLDEQAPMAPVEGGTATATKGDHASYVRIELSGHSVGAPLPQTYQLRAIADDGEASAPSASISGQRGLGSTEIQWHRTTGEDDVDADYEELPDATGPGHNDTTAPADGSPRYYRATVTADGAETATSAADFGYRPADGSFAAMSVDNIGSDAADLSAEVDGLGQPPADEYGFCLSDSPAPSYPLDCEALGSPDAETAAISWTTTELDPGTEYFARAYLRVDGEDPSYSDEISFTTLLAAPQNLSASTDDPVAVNLSWDPVSDAVAYEISIDEGPWTELGDTAFADDQAPAPTIELTAPTASTDDSTGVQLSLAPITAEPGAALSYRVRAIDDQGRASEDVQATGNRAAGTIVASWQYRDATEDPFQELTAIADVANPDHFDDTLAAGESRTYRVEAAIDEVSATQITSDEVEGTRAP